MNVPKQAIAFAPASIGNLGVGFDILGQTFEGAGDKATVRRIAEPVVRIAAIHGLVTTLPLEAARNTAGAALLSLRRALGLRHGFELELHKGIALGSGMGGSAASCVAALVAANALLERPLPREALYGFAMDGETVASRSRLFLIVPAVRLNPSSSGKRLATIVESVRAIRAACRSRSSRPRSGTRNSQLSNASLIVGSRSARQAMAMLAATISASSHQ